VVVVVLAILGAVVVPMISGTDDLQATSAGRMVAADLEYAQNVAITTQDVVSVTFDPAAESYTLSSNASGVLIHPMTKAAYRVDFRTQEALDRVDIVTADFGGASTVSLDELGSPTSGGSVRIEAGGVAYLVEVAPVTGLVTVTTVGP